MPKQSKASQKNTSIMVRDISNTSGTVNIAGGDITTHTTTGLSAAEIKTLFAQLYTAIETDKKVTPPARKT